MGDVLLWIAIVLACGSLAVSVLIACAEAATTSIRRGPDGVGHWQLHRPHLHHGR